MYWQASRIAGEALPNNLFVKIYDYLFFHRIKEEEYVAPTAVSFTRFD